MDEMATDWSDEAKARRSAAAKKAAETRKANQDRARLKAAEFGNYVDTLRAEAVAEEKHVAARRAEGMNNAVAYPYITNSRVARWALSGASLIAMLCAVPNMQRRDLGTDHPFYN